MNIAMFTNAYLPHVGGVANSVSQFTEGYRRRGHRVLVVAPDYGERPENERDVVRLTALRNFRGTSFAAALPISLELDAAVDRFEAEVIHSHHPFLIGDTALRLSAARQIPIVFTHHTMYEHYTHYIPLDMAALKPFVVRLATGYANMCDHVIAPSESVRDILRERGVQTPIDVVPTGVDVERFRHGNGAAARRRHGVPDDAFVVGHVGRLAPEKNLPFLARASAAFAKQEAKGHALFVGDGSAVDEIHDIFATRGLQDRLHMTGILKGRDLVDAYHAMDVFAFASTSETQGMVLVEALAAGCPVAALDAPGAREVIDDGANGRLLPEQDVAEFARALGWVASMEELERRELRERARLSARPFAMDRCVDRALELYRLLRHSPERRDDLASGVWDALLDSLRCEWELWRGRLNAVSEAAREAEGQQRKGGAR